MIFAMFKVMALRLLRDKGVLFLTFALPPVIFTVLAAIFSSASGGDLDLTIAVFNESEAPATIEFMNKFSQADVFAVKIETSREAVRDIVRDGNADAGVVFASDLSNSATAKIDLIVEPSKEIAAMILAGELQRQLSESAGPSASEDMFNRISAIDADITGAKDPAIGYYAGAIAIMFLLFSAMHSAALSLEERQTQIPHRLSMQLGRYLQFTGGKFLFLVLQGTLQSAVILTVAAFLFGIPIMNNLGLLTFASLAMAAASAGIALFITSLCRSAAQAHTVSTFLVLISSAIGGSMVPRFMMPDWLQSAGFVTPNTWAIEAVYGILVRGEGFGEIFANCAILFGIGVVCYIMAVFVAMHQIGRS